MRKKLAVGEDTAEGTDEAGEAKKFEGCQKLKGGKSGETDGGGNRKTALEVGWERAITFKRMNER